MNFYSPHYFLFLFLILLVYILIPQRKNGSRKIFLILVSFAFYFTFNFYLPLLLFLTILLDFWIIEKFKTENLPILKRKALLTFGIAANFGPLIFLRVVSAFDFFKGFLVDLNYSTDLLIPVGISFYTFKSVSCLIDSYNDPKRGPSSFLNYGLFVSFFPALLCGPISRYEDFQESLQLRNPDPTHLHRASIFICRGLFYKLVLANNLSQALMESVNTIELNFLSSLLISSVTVLQVYFDFAGYSEVARGSAQLFSITLPRNFNFSFFSTNIAEFWRRHHISMSEWFRDYIYLPIQFKLHGRIHTTSMIIIAALITFIVSGFWHGFTKGALFFGIIQGLSIACYTLSRPYIKPFLTKNKGLKVPATILARILMWMVTCISFSFLLLPTRNSLLKVMKGFTDFSAVLNQSQIQLLAWATATVLLSILFSSVKGYRDFWNSNCGPIAAGILLVLVFIFQGQDLPFIYYRF